MRVKVLTITLLIINTLSYIILGKFKDAEGVYKLCLDSRKEILGDEHAYTLNTVTLLANALNQQGKFSEAESLYRDNLAKQKQILGEDHIQTLTTATSLATCCAKQGIYY